jgi:hypothetical protein
MIRGSIKTTRAIEKLMDNNAELKKYILMRNNPEN